MPTEETKLCPYCAESINSNALKCKHCKTFLDEEEVKNNSNKNEEPDDNQDFKKSIEQLENKLQKLEANNRNKNYWLISAFAVILIAWIYTAGDDTSEVGENGIVNADMVYANSFVVVDEEGKPYAGLGYYEGNVILGMYDHNENLRFSIETTQEGAKLMLYNNLGDSSMIINSSRDGSQIFMYDFEGMPRNIIGYSRDHNSTISMYDENGNPIWWAP